MTAADIVQLLFRPVDAERIAKAKGAAQRHGIAWDAVLKAMTPDQRQQVGE